MRRLRWRPLASLMLASVLVACAQPASGISVSGAVAEARRQFGFEVTDVIAAQRAPLRTFLSPGEGVPGDTSRHVWAITIRGSFGFPCPMAADGGSTDHCPPDADRMTIFVDAQDGTFLYARTPGVTSSMMAT